LRVCGQLFSSFAKALRRRSWSAACGLRLGVSARRGKEKVGLVQGGGQAILMTRMPSETPPPLPSREPMLLTYLRAVGLLLPALFMWIYNNNFLLPKVMRLWAHTDLPGSDAQWIADAAVFLTEYMTVVVGLALALFLLPELLWQQWPRYRGVAVALFTVLVNAVVLFGVTAISTTLIVALPTIRQTK
jgi:hypothetical protein